MTRESDEIVHSFNVSTLSSNYYFNCQKNYYLLSARKKGNNSKEQPANSSNGQTSNQSTTGSSQGDSSNSLDKERGKEFEKKIRDSLEKRNLLAKTYNDFKVALENANSGEYLYNQTFTVDNTLYANVIENDEVYKIANFRPDFVYVTNDEKTKKKIRIIDAKASKRIQETHKIQVVSYWFLIQHLIKNMDIILDTEVGIWLPSDENNPILFPICSKIDEDKDRTIIEEVEDLYKKTLTNIIKSGQYEWDLQKKCHTCDYYKICKKDAEGTVKELPYNSKERYDHYKKYMLKDIKDIEDIEDLTRKMQGMSLNEQYTSQQNTRLQRHAKCRKIKKPIFFGYTTTLVSEEPERAIYVSFLKDDFTYNPYAFAFHISPKAKISKNLLEYCLNKSYYQNKTQREDAFCEITKRFIEALYTILDNINDRKPKERCLFYVYDNNEMYDIKNFLSELVSSQGKDLKSLESAEKKDVVKKATKCLVTLFQDSILLDVPTLEDRPCLDKIEKNVLTGRFVVIEQLLEQNVALPAQVYYEVSDAVKWMVDPEAAVYNFKKEWEEFSKKKNQSDLFAKKTNKKQLDLLEQLQKVMEKYWELSKTTTLTTTELFPLSCPLFKWPDTFSYNYNYFGCNYQILARILYFTEYIRLFKRRECQKAPIADLDIASGYKTSSKLSSLTLVSKVRKDGSHTFVVDITGNEKDIKDRLKSLGYDNTNGYKHILVPDTYKDIVKMFKYTHDLGTYEKAWITVLNISKVDQDTQMINLRVGPESIAADQRFRLYKTYEDKNLFKNMFEEIDKATKDSIVDLLQNPNAWSVTDRFDDIHFNSSKTRESLDKYSLLLPHQKAINTKERRLHLIWGSGNVKKQFLAQFIHWYRLDFVKRNQSKGLVIGVAAKSKYSVLELLQEVEKIQNQEHNEHIKAFSIIYVTEHWKERDEESKILYCQPKNDSKIKIYQKRVTVIGAKFPHWEYIKKRKDFSNCEMMIIDDGSKMHVPDALLPLGCLSSTLCKLIVAGDINYKKKPFSYDYYRTTTSDNVPLLYGSIQQCLTRKKDNVVIETDGKDVNSLKDLGPNTLKL